MDALSSGGVDVGVEYIRCVFCERSHPKNAQHCCSRPRGGGVAYQRHVVAYSYAKAVCIFILAGTVALIAFFAMSCQTRLGRPDRLELGYAHGSGEGHYSPGGGDPWLGNTSTDSDIVSGTLGFPILYITDEADVCNRCGLLSEQLGDLREITRGLELERANLSGSLNSLVEKLGATSERVVTLEKEAEVQTDNPFGALESGSAVASLFAVLAILMRFGLIPSIQPKVVKDVDSQ